MCKYYETEKVAYGPQLSDAGTTTSRRIPAFQRLVQVGTRSNRCPPAAPHRVGSAINSRRQSSHQPHSTTTAWSTQLLVLLARRRAVATVSFSSRASCAHGSQRAKTQEDHMPRRRRFAVKKAGRTRALCQNSALPRHGGAAHPCVFGPTEPRPTALYFSF